MTSLPSHLIKNSDRVSGVEKSKEIHVCHTWLKRRLKSLPAAKNPIKIHSWICCYPRWKEKFFFSFPKRVCGDILTWSVFARLIPVWTLTSSVLSEAHAFNAFTMADKPTDKTSPLTEKKERAGAGASILQVILKSKKKEKNKKKNPNGR